MQLDSEVPGAPDRPSTVLVPHLLNLFKSPHEDCKCLAVSIMNLLAGGMPHAVAGHLDTCAACPGSCPCPACAGGGHMRSQRLCSAAQRHCGLRFLRSNRQQMPRPPKWGRQAACPAGAAAE